MKGFGDSKPNSGNKKPQLKDLVEIAKLDKEFRTFRLVGPIISYYNFWFNIKTKTGKKISVPRLCLDFDSSIDDFNGDKCPYRASGAGRGSKFYLANVIDRELQENKPRKTSEPTKSERKTRKLLGDYECHIIDGKGSKSWTPMRVLQLPASQGERLRGMMRLNVHKNKKTGKSEPFELSHPKYGKDINIKYDPDVAGPNKYDILPAKDSRLSEEELEYLMWPLDVLKTDKLEVAQRDMEELEKVIVDEDGKSTSKKRKKSDDYEGDVDSDEGGSDGDSESGSDSDDDDKKSKKKKKKSDSDNDSTPDSESDDDDKKSKKKKKKKSDSDDDSEPDSDDKEDSDLGSDDDDDSDKGSRKMKLRRR